MPDEKNKRRGRARSWPLYVGCVIVGACAAVTGVLLAATHPSAHAHRHGPVFVIVFAGAAAVAVAAMVVWSLRRQLNRPEMQHLRSFRFSQRRAVVRAVNSGARLTGQQRSIAQAQLEQMTSASRKMRWALPLAVIMFAALALANTAGLRWLWAAIALLELASMTATMLLYRRQIRRIEKALV